MKKEKADFIIVFLIITILLLVIFFGLLKYYSEKEIKSLQLEKKSDNEICIHYLNECFLKKRQYLDKYLACEGELLSK